MYVILDDRTSLEHPLARPSTWCSPVDAERFPAEVRGDDPEIAAKLRIEEHDLEGVGSPNYASTGKPSQAARG